MISISKDTWLRCIVGRTRSIRFIPRGILTGVLWRGSSAVFAFFSNLLLARLLGANGYGAYAFAVAALSTMSVLGLMGLDKLTARELSILYHKRDWKGYWAFLKWSRVNLLTVSISSAVLGGLVVTLLPLAFEMKQATLLTLPAVPLLAYLYLTGGRLQATDRAALGIFFALTLRNFGLVVLAYVLLLHPGLRNPTSAVLGYTIIILITLVLAVIAFQSGTRETLRPDETILSGHRWRHMMWRFGALGILNTLHMDGYILLVGLLLDTEAAGLYSVAHRSATTILLFLGPIEIIVAPLIARAWNQGDRIGVQRQAQLAGRIGLMFSAPLLFTFLVMPDWFLSSIYGPEYIKAATVLRILTLGQLALVLLGPANIVLAMSGYESKAVTVFALSLGIGMLMVFALASVLGVVGAAIGAAIGLVLRALGAALCVWRTQSVCTVIVSLGRK